MQLNNADFKVQGPQILQFNEIQLRKNPRSAFNRSYTHRTTLNTDYLYPIFVDEILPGDDVHIAMDAILRLTTPIKPIMDNLYAETFWFFVPYRLVMDKWEALQGQQENPGDSVDYSMPLISFDNSNKHIPLGGVASYFGINAAAGATTDFSVHDPGITSIYHRGYRLCWNQWFRDENLLDSVTINTSQTADPIQNIDSLLKRGKRKDYFTSALPWPQKGTAIDIPFGTQAPLVNTGLVAIVGQNQIFRTVSSGSTLPGTQLNSAATTAIIGHTNGTPGFVDVSTTHQLDTTAYADLSSATAVTINDLRQAALYQQILELDARGGTRYVESIFSRFGVVSPDFRLQRPELIGVGQTPVNVYAVPQTAPSPTTPTSTNAQGNLAAFGTSISKGHHQAKYAATEHGMILGLLNVRADLTYQQGIPRMFTRSVRHDFYEPLLNGLGEQAILNKEIYADGSTHDAEVFGYQERSSEYKQRPSMITGLFNSAQSAPLDVWHLSQKFGSLPILGSSSFIEEAVPMDRVVAVTSEPKFYCDMWFKYNHVRTMPMHSSPGIDVL